MNNTAMNSTTDSDGELGVTWDVNVSQRPTTHTYVVGTALIVKSFILSLLMIVNLFGNGLVLTAIRTTPSFWTKTNKILASLTVADMLSGVTVIYYVPYTLITSVFNNSCRYNVANVATRWLFMFPPYAASFSLIVVAVDRYVAVVHPLQYEVKMTDRVVHWMIAVAWFAGFTCAMGNVMWLINADLIKCVIIPVGYNFLDTSNYILVIVVVFPVYVKILLVAWRQHVTIGLTAVTRNGKASNDENRKQVRNLRPKKDRCFRLPDRL
jgi:hypothetical protein